MSENTVLQRSALLAFASGFVDCAAFIHMGGLFVAHVTGNFVLLGAAVTAGGLKSHETASALQLASLPLFFATVVLAVILARAWPDERRTARLVWLSAGLVLLAAGHAALGPAADASAAIALIAAMAILNAAQRLDPGLGAPFTVMTGNVTGLGVQLAQALVGQPSQGSPAKKTGGVLLVAGFAIGCAAGAIGETRIGWTAMVLPALALVAAGARR